MTDSCAAKIISKGWAEKIDHANVPNCRQEPAGRAAEPAVGPENDYHYPWQSGMTGIGYNAKALTRTTSPRRPRSPTCGPSPPNKVEFLTEARDTFGLALLKIGKIGRPGDVTADDLQAVHDDIKPLRRQGPAFIGQDYLQYFAAKKVVGRHGLVGRPRLVGRRGRQVRRSPKRAR